MNEVFQSLVDEVNDLTGKRNSPELVKAQILLVTGEEHGSRKFHRDYDTYSWTISDEDGSSVINDTTNMKYTFSLDVRELMELAIWTQNYEWNNDDYVLDPRLFMPTCGVPNGIHVLQAGNKYQVKASEPILAYQYVSKKPLMLDPDNYNSWIAESNYRSVIVYEAAARVMAVIGDSTERSFKAVANEARKHLRTLPHYP